MPKGGETMFTDMKRCNILNVAVILPALYPSFHFPHLHGENLLRFVIPMHASGRRFIPLLS